MKDKAKVSLIECKSYDEAAVGDAMEKLMAQLGGMKAFTGPGKKIFIKPNLLLAAKPESACTTHPAVIEAVIRQVQKTGAEVFFGDLPGGFHIGSTSTIYDKCGMARVAKNTGANLVKLEQYGFRDREIVNGKKLDLIHTPKLLDEMDALINVCKLKTHMQSLYTGAIKNMFGFITTRDRMNAHAFNKLPTFSAVLVDIFSALRPQLNIMDAIVGMEGTGPSQGTPVKLNMLLASDDAVALDAVAAAATGFNPNEILTTRFAAERGLGVADLKEIQVLGTPISKLKKNIKRPSRFVFTMLPMLNDILSDLTKVKPLIDSKKCKKCKNCVEVCPASAINMDGDFRIDDDKCILCFCCHEMCPHGAVVLKKAPLVKAAEMFISRSNR